MDKRDGNGGAPASAGREREPLRAEIVEEGSSWSSGGGAYGGGGRQGWSGRTLSFAAIDNTGCAAALTTCFVFFLCLFQWGLLAAIGFIVFHTIGNVIASVYSARRLMRGIICNVWSLRAANWIISFFITAWLAGGFK